MHRQLWTGNHVFNRAYIFPVSLSIRTYNYDRLVLGHAEMIPRRYLFWGDQVGFKFSPPFHCLLNAFFCVFEFPGGS